MMSAVRCTAQPCQGCMLPRCCCSIQYLLDSYHTELVQILWYYMVQAPPRAPTLIGGPWTCDTCARTVGASTVQVCSLPRGDLATCPRLC